MCLYVGQLGIVGILQAGFVHEAGRQVQRPVRSRGRRNRPDPGEVGRYQRCLDEVIDDLARVASGLRQVVRSEPVEVRAHTERQFGRERRPDDLVSEAEFSNVVRENPDVHRLADQSHHLLKGQAGHDTELPGGKPLVEYGGELQEPHAFIGQVRQWDLTDGQGPRPSRLAHLGRRVGSCCAHGLGHPGEEHGIATCRGQRGLHARWEGLSQDPRYQRA